MPSVDWSSPWTWGLIVFVLFHLAVTGGLMAACAILLFRKVKTDVHTGAQALSKWLTSKGFSAMVTGPLDDLAAGNLAGAVGDEVKMVQYLSNAQNQGNELANVFTTAWNDPQLGPTLQQLVKDLQGGASKEQIQTDMGAVVSASRAGAQSLLNSLPLTQQIHQFQTILPQLKGLALPDAASVLDSMGLGHFLPAVAAIAAPVTAPVAIPAAVAAAAGVAVSGLKHGDVVTVSADGTPTTSSVAPSTTTQAA